MPYNVQWLNLKKSPANDVTLLIPSIQLEIICFVHDFAFTLRLPSQTFGDAMEGLCGDCNGNLDDDFKQQNGKVSKNIVENKMKTKNRIFFSNLEKNKINIILLDNR